MSDAATLSLGDDIQEMADIGIVGGYGFADRIDIDREIDVETPFGEPTHPVIIGEMAGRKVAFLSRHGRGRNVPSQSVNFRANLFALYRVGVRRLVSATANGSLRKEIGVGDVAVPTDYIDRTKRRVDTFFDDYPPRHFSSMQPFCPSLNDTIESCCDAVGLTGHNEDVTMVNIEGPRFSTEAESEMFRQWGADIVGGSTYPEVTLARELGMCYGNFALITDYDVGDSIPGIEEEPVTLQMIDDRLAEYNTQTRDLMEQVIERMPAERCEHCQGHVDPATSEADPLWEHRRPDMF
jgi:5'-methylthioadenosine phosphorylase